MPNRISNLKMTLPIRFAIFCTACLLLNYLVYAPNLADSYLLIRFAGWSLLNLLGGVLLLYPLKKWTLNKLEISLFAFYLWSSVSILWSDNFGEAIFTNQRYLLLAVTVILFRQGFIHWKAHPRGLALIIDATLLVTLVITSVQLLRLGNLEGKAVYQIIGHAGHKNLLASFLLLLTGLQIFFGFYHRREIWFWPLLAWSAVLLVLLRSRGVFMGGLAGGMLTLGVLALLRIPEVGKLRQRTAWVVLGIGLSLGVFLLGTDTGKAYQRHFNPLSYSESTSATERLFVWYKTTELIKDRPWLGFGTGNWKLFFPSKNISGGYRLQEQDLIFTRTHNDFLEITTELGIPGLLLYLVSFVLAFVLLHRSWRRAKKLERKLAILTLAATLLAYMVVAFFDFPKERIEHQVYLAFLFALAGYLTYGSKEESGWLIPQPRFMALALTAILLVNVPVSYYRYQGEWASRIILGVRSQPAKGATIDKAAAQGFSTWYEVDPMVIPLPWYRGTYAYAEGDFEQATSFFAQAYQINPYNFNVVNNYGTTLVRVKRYQDAVDLYLEALAINPKFEDGMFNLAFAYYQLKEYEKALEWARKPKGNPERQAEFLQNIQSAMEADKKE